MFFFLLLSIYCACCDSLHLWVKHFQTIHDGFIDVLTLLTLVQCNVHKAFVFYDQGLDGEATEPMIKELDEEREESQDPEIEFAIAGAVRECGGLEIILSMIQVCTF